MEVNWSLDDLVDWEYANQWIKAKRGYPVREIALVLNGIRPDSGLGQRYDSKSSSFSDSPFFESTEDIQTNMCSQLHNEFDVSPFSTGDMNGILDLQKVMTWLNKNERYQSKQYPTAILNLWKYNRLSSGRYLDEVEALRRDHEKKREAMLAEAKPEVSMNKSSRRIQPKLAALSETILQPVQQLYLYNAFLNISAARMYYKGFLSGQKQNYDGLDKVSIFLTTSEILKPENESWQNGLRTEKNNGLYKAESLQKYHDTVEKVMLFTKV